MAQDFNNAHNRSVWFLHKMEIGLTVITQRVATLHKSGKGWECHSKSPYRGMGPTVNLDFDKFV